MGACAMSAPRPAEPTCRVTGGEKLLSSAGGAAQLCAAVRRAVAGHPASPQVDVTVAERSMFLVGIRLQDGRVLPTFTFAEIDRPISERTFARLGEAVARRIRQIDTPDNAPPTTAR